MTTDSEGDEPPDPDIPFQGLMTAEAGDSGLQVEVGYRVHVEDEDLDVEEHEDLLIFTASMAAMRLIENHEEVLGPSGYQSPEERGEGAAYQ